MTVERTVLNWRVPVGVWEQFVDHVADFHGTAEGYARFELERAMREFLDDDELEARAEDLLREYTDLQGLSSSTARGIGTDRYQAETMKLGYRVNADLKERFAIFADKHDADSYGRALAAALDSYARGGRARRMVDNLERLVTGGCTRDSTDASVENRGSSRDGEFSTESSSGITTESGPDTVDVEARHVIAIADELPDTLFPRSALDSAIVRVVGGEGAQIDEATIDAYREAVLDQLDASEHPHPPDGKDLYITDEHREDLTLWADLDKAERLILLRRFAAADAVEERECHRSLTYRQVQGLFDHQAGGGKPSHQYAYELMAEAADEPGFEYGEYHGQLQFRVDLNEVSQEILEWVEENTEDGVSLSDLRVDADVTSWSAGAAPSREVAGDD